MNHYSYCYTLLQYRHTSDLDELINIGLLVHSAPMKVFVFIRPNDLKRLELIYPDVEIGMINRYYQYFQTRVQGLAKERKDWWNSPASFQEFIDSEFLMPHSTKLQFGRVKISMRNFKDFRHLKEHLYRSYFMYYDRVADLKFENGFRWP